VGKEVENTDEYRGARFTRVDLSGSTLRDVDLTGAKIVDAMLVNTDVSGLITGMRVNGVEVAPLVEAELDRRHPERVKLRATTPAGLRDGWATVEAMWEPTIEQARQLPETIRQQRVDDEWSLVETLRHLIFVIDGWFGRAVLGEDDPYHPFGLPPAFIDDSAALGLEVDARPSFDDVLDVRHARMARVSSFLASATADDLGRPSQRDDTAGYPPVTEHTVLACLHIVMDEEWNHHQYAIRDLASLTG
jgi:DinB superfamily/Pentapeptide repeats (8 copies)